MLWVSWEETPTWNRESSASTRMQRTSTESTGSMETMYVSVRVALTTFACFRASRKHSVTYLGLNATRHVPRPGTACRP